MQHRYARNSIKRNRWPTLALALNLLLPSGKKPLIELRVSVMRLYKK